MIFNVGGIMQIFYYDVPGARMESPPFQPISSRICVNTTLSMRMNTGAISYVNMFVLAVAVSHSPAIDTKSKPHDSWLKNLGWPNKRRRKLLLLIRKKQIQVKIFVLKKKQIAWWNCKKYYFNNISRYL